MKKHIHILVILLCIFQYIPAQNIDKKEFIIDAAYRYTPHHQSLYRILDTLSNSLQNCVFTALNRDYFFEISIYKDNTISCQIYPYVSYPWGILDRYRNMNKKTKGFFYYNEKLVLVRFIGEQWAPHDPDYFFSIHYDLEIVMYSAPAEPLPQAGKALDVVTLDALYDSKTGDFTITKFYGCNGSKHYVYTVLKSDTWETVAAKFGTTVENIQTINKVYNPDFPLEAGDDIIVNYKIIDGVLQVTRER